MLKIWKMKVFRIRQSIAHFDQWKPLISKMPFKLKSNGRPPRLLRFWGHFRGHWSQNFIIFMNFHLEFCSFLVSIIVGRIFSKITFLESVASTALIKTLYSWSYLFDFHPKITSGQGCAGSLRMNANRL